MGIHLGNLYDELIKGYDGKLSHSGVNGERLVKRLDLISQIGATTDGKGVRRVGYSPEEKKAKELVTDWMKEAGLQITIDGAGNVFGRLEGKKNGPAVMSGSHLDSVPNGGSFDGPLGVLAALEVVEAWKETGYIPPNPYEVAVFSDEEGSRFNSGLTGSRAFMGKITSKELDSFIDEQGRLFDEVIEEYGSSREEYLKPYFPQKNIGLFVEVHIEQGKILEKNNEPVGIVSGIAGPAWLEVTFRGEAGHAGNTPMIERKDPLVAAAMFVKEIELLPRLVSSSAVATVGKLNVYPNGINVIAKEVSLMVDIRDIFEDTRDTLVDLIEKKAKSIAEERNITVSCGKNTDIKPLPIQNELQEKLTEICTDMGINPVYIPSGAGHDAMILGEEVPVAMIFARSKDGISHRPDEWTSLNDGIKSVHVLKRFIQKIMEGNCI